MMAGSLPRRCHRALEITAPVKILEPLTVDRLHAQTFHEGDGTTTPWT